MKKLNFEYECIQKQADRLEAEFNLNPMQHAVLIVSLEKIYRISKSDAKKEFIKIIGDFKGEEYTDKEIWLDMRKALKKQLAVKKWVGIVYFVVVQEHGWGEREMKKNELDNRIKIVKKAFKELTANPQYMKEISKLSKGKLGDKEKRSRSKEKWN